MSKRKETKVVTDNLSPSWKKYLKRLSSKIVRVKSKEVIKNEIKID